MPSTDSLHGVKLSAASVTRCSL